MNIEMMGFPMTTVLAAIGGLLVLVFGFLIVIAKFYRKVDQGRALIVNTRSRMLPRSQRCVAVTRCLPRGMDGPRGRRTASSKPERSLAKLSAPARGAVSRGIRVPDSPPTSPFCYPSAQPDV